MNLKQAASRLGVHYQTAYRWVRSGDLAAVRVGARYEVSDAAIHQFVATRQSVLRQAVPQPDAPTSGTSDPEEVLLDLEAMAGDPLISVPALTQYAARRGREALGDLCLVALTHEDGSIDRAALDHAHADRAAFVASALSVMGPTPPRVGALLAPVLRRGEVVRIPHVPQDRLRAGIRPELRQYLDDHPVVGVISAPVRIRGAVRGMVVFTRDTPAHPYTEEDERFVVRFAERISTLALAAEEIERCWTIRERLAKRFHAWLAGQALDAQFDPATVAELLDTDEDPGAAVAVYDPEGRIIGASKVVAQVAGYDIDRLVGTMFTEVVEPEDVAQERDNFARLVSGELDYHDLHAHRRRSDGTLLDYAMHRVAVRRLDSTLACVISVGRPVRTSARVQDLIGAR